MTTTIPETVFEGINLRTGLYQITSGLGSSPIFPFTCTGQAGTRYKNRIVYILDASRSKIAACNSALGFSVCEHCFHTLPASLQSMFIPVFVAQYDGLIKCSSHYFRASPTDSVSCAIYNRYIINVEYKTPAGTWSFADVNIDATTITVKFPVAECEFRINIISGFYPENNDYSTYTLNSVAEDLTILSKMFDKNFYSQIGAANMISISKSRFDASSNSAQALKFTAVSKDLASSASALCSVPEVREYGNNRLHLCVHSAKSIPVLPTVHAGITCDGCGQHSFTGARHYCTICDFDLCQSCYHRGFSHVHQLYRTTAKVYAGVRVRYDPPGAMRLSDGPMFRGVALSDVSSRGYTSRGIGGCTSKGIGSSMFEGFSAPAGASAFSFAASASAPVPASAAPASAFSFDPFAPVLASAAPTLNLFTGAVTAGSVQSNVTTSTARFGDHVDLLELFIQIFCTDASAVDATSEKFKETVVPTVPPRWTFPPL